MYWVILLLSVALVVAGQSLPDAAVAAPFMNLSWVVQQTAVDAGRNLFHQPWPPNVRLPIDVNVTRYVMPAPWRLLFARAVPVDVSNPTGQTALYINVYVALNTALLISQGLMRRDCADVVAVTEWGDPLPTWVEDCNTAASRVWVMIPVLPPGTWRIWLLHGCPSCRVATDSSSVFLYYEDMQRPPRGILAGSASYDAANRWVQLTPPTTSQLGYLVYTIPPVLPTAVYVKFRFMIRECSWLPADAVWFGVYDSNYVGTTEDIVRGGYHLTADWPQSRVCFTKSTSDNGPGIACASYSFSQGVWYTYEGYLWYDGSTVRSTIILNGATLINNAADSWPQPNAVNGIGLVVFGGRTGASYCRHILGPLMVAHFDPRITTQIGQPVSPPPSLVPPRLGFVTYRVYVNSTHALLNGTASPGVLAAPFTYTLHSLLTSVAVGSGGSTFYSLSVSPSGFAAFRSRVNGIYSMRNDAAYYDATAQGNPFFTFNLNITSTTQTVVLGFDAVWTPGDSYRGWVSVWRWGNLWLNVSLVSRHSVAAPGLSVVAHSGSYALERNSVGICTLYANGTAVSSAACPAPSGALTLLAPANSPSIRMTLRSAWISLGDSQIFFDFRFVPPISSVGAVNRTLPSVKMGGSPGLLHPVVLTGAVRITNALWGPFGEICPGRLPNGTLVAFGVRYAWQSPSDPPSCSVPLQTAPPAGTLITRMPFNITAPLQLYFPSPPVQHPYLVNSVPARFCSPNAVHYTTPYLPATAKLSEPATLVSDHFACAPIDYAPPDAHLARVRPGWGLIAPTMRVFRINTTSVVYAGSGSAVLVRDSTVPAMSVQAADSRTWHIYTSGAVAVAATSLQSPPNVPRSGGVVSGIFGVPRSPSTLVSVWWSDGTRYYVTAAGLADSPVVYISSFTGSPIAVHTELNAPSGHSYYIGVLNSETYVWAVPLTGPASFTTYVPTPGYYTVRLYRGEDKVWERSTYLSPDARLMIGPIEIPVFIPANPVSLVTPAAPKPPVFVPAITMEVPPYAVGILLLGVFAAAYVSTREVSLASLITGAVVIVLGVLMGAPIYSIAGVFFLAFGLWNKSRRQGSI
jgi:branched-subunit amino acid transport protein AzlD